MASFASLIVSAWNRPELFKPFYRALRDNTHYPYELIVHDDGSDWEMQDWLARQAAMGGISTLISNPIGHNRGHGTAVNRAAAIAEGEYIVKLNGDETFADGWLAQAVKAMETYPEIELLHLAHYYSYGPREVPIEKVVWDLAPYTLHKENRQGVPIRVVWVGPGCAFMVRKSTWIEKGPWQATYNPAFTEDIEYRMRLCPMMRLLDKGRPYPPPEDLGAHWDAYQNTPWLAVLDPPMVSYHPGHGLCSIGRSRATLKQGPYLKGDAHESE